MRLLENVLAALPTLSRDRPTLLGRPGRASIVELQLSANTAVAARHSRITGRLPRRRRRW